MSKWVIDEVWFWFNDFKEEKLYIYGEGLKLLN